MCIHMFKGKQWAQSSQPLFILAELPYCRWSATSSSSLRPSSVQTLEANGARKWRCLGAHSNYNSMISRDKKLIKWAKGIVCLQLGIVRVRLYQTFSLFFGYHTLCSRHVTTVQRHNLRTRAPSLSWRPSTPNMKYETGNRIPSWCGTNIERLVSQQTLTQVGQVSHLLAICGSIGVGLKGFHPQPQWKECEKWLWFAIWENHLNSESECEVNLVAIKYHRPIFAGFQPLFEQSCLLSLLR